MLAAAALTAPVAAAQPAAGIPGFVVESERFTPEGGSPVDLRFMIAPERIAQKARLVSATHAALTTMSNWFGAPPLPSPLTIAGVNCRPSEAMTVPAGSGTVSACLHWLAPVRDQQTERQVIRGIALEYWMRSGAHVDDFVASLIWYSANRAIHQQLEGSNFGTERFFGGYVPFPLRSVLLSPPVSDPRPRVLHFGDLDDVQRPAHVRGVRALQSIERYVGWPTMLQAVSQLRTVDPSNWSPEGLGKILSDVRGTDLRPLVSECFRSGGVFDYAIESVESRDVGGQIESTVTIARRGDARFALGDDEGDRDATIPVRVRFADSRELVDRIDGAAPSTALLYTAGAPVVSAAVDPGVMLVLDANRDNNEFVRDRRTMKLGVRLAMNWLAWLQNAMLSYTALL